MRDHCVTHEISRAYFDTNTIKAKHRCHRVHDFKCKSASILDRATIFVIPLVEVTDTCISTKMSE